MARQHPYLRHLHSLKQPPLPVVFIFKMNTVRARHLSPILDLITSFAHPALREQGPRFILFVCSSFLTTSLG